MAESGQRSPFQRFWDGLGHFGKIRNLFIIATAFTTAARKLSVMPGGWHEPQYWMSAGEWFFGAWLVAASAVRGIERGWAKVHPPSATLDVYGGENVSIVLTNTGPVPVKYLATGQLLDSSEVRFKRIRPFSLTIWHGHYFQSHETTHGILAEISRNSYGPDEFWLRGDTSELVERWQAVINKWIRVTLTIRTEPPLPSGPIQRSYEFCFDGTIFTVREFMPQPR